MSVKTCNHCVLAFLCGLLFPVVSQANPSDSTASGEDTSSFQQDRLTMLEMGLWHIPPTGFVLGAGMSHANALGLTAGFTIQVGILEPTDETVRVCDNYGMGKNCKTESYSKKIYGLDLFGGWTKRIGSSGRLAVRLLGDATLDLISVDAGTDCVNCSKSDEGYASVVFRPELIWMPTANAAIVVGPRLDLAGKTSGVALHLNLQESSRPK